MKKATLILPIVVIALASASLIVGADRGIVKSSGPAGLSASDPEESTFNSVRQDTTCPPGTIFGQPVHPPTSWNAATSDLGIGYTVFDNFDYADGIDEIKFWGINGFFDAGWSECYEDSMCFLIHFYTDAGGQPGAVVTTYVVWLTGTPVGDWSGWTLYKYSTHLDPPPVLDFGPGWVSVEGGAGDDPDCWFLWMSGYGMDQFALQWDFTIQDYVTLDYDLAFCLIGPTGEPNDPPAPGISKHNVDGFHPSFGNPLGTIWHELSPDYCDYWELTSWRDNGDGVLSYCDTVDFVDMQTGRKVWEHVEWVGPTLTLWNPQYPDTIYLDLVEPPNPMVDPIYEPIGTLWHNIYPGCCSIHEIVDWYDNGNGYLDYCDFVIIRAHENYVEYHVEAVETDIITRPVPIPDIDQYDHNIDGYLPDMGNPMGSFWHELYPTYCNVWFLEYWGDNGDGILSFCDTILLWQAEPPTDSMIWKHVEWVGPTITTTAIPAGGTVYFDLLDPANPWVNPMYEADLMGSYWQNVWPGCCTSYEFVAWDDNGNGYLDYCDYIQLAGGHDTLWYHVEAYETDIATRILSPYTCGDADGNGMVNISDAVYLITYIFGGGPPPSPLCVGDANGDGLVNISDAVYLIAYIFGGGPAPVTDCCDPPW